MYTVKTLNRFGAELYLYKKTLSTDQADRFNSIEEASEAVFAYEREMGPRVWKMDLCRAHRPQLEAP